MKQTVLPLWTGDNGVTYTSLDKKRRKLYIKRGSDLITQAHTILNESESSDISLLALNEISLSLSALNPEWMEFDSAVFQLLIYEQNLTEHVKKELLELMNDARKRIRDCENSDFSSFWSRVSGSKSGT